MRQVAPDFELDQWKHQVGASDFSPKLSNMIIQLSHTRRHSASPRSFSAVSFLLTVHSGKMVVTYVTYVRMLNPLGPMSELISFADRDYEACTYTYVLGPIWEGPILMLSTASAVFSSMAGQSEGYRWSRG